MDCPQKPKHLKDPEGIFYLIEYRDGLRTTVAMSTGLARQFAFAGEVQGQRIQWSPPLLTTRALDAFLHSIAEGYRVIETPELAISYQAAD